MILVRSRFFLQSLVLGWWWPTDMKITREESLSQMDYLDGTSNEIGAIHNEISSIPDPTNYPLMARFVVHNANWTAVAYTSHQKGTEGRALADMFSVADGPMDKGTGIPYIYVSRLQAAVSDVLDHDGKASLVMSLAETDICKSKDWDPEDPRCAHVTLVGTLSIVDKNSAEYQPAKDGVFQRHPSFKGLPVDHGFFLAKLSLTGITLQDNFGGPVDVSVQDYFKASSTHLGIVPNYSSIFNNPLDSYFVYDMENQIN